MGIGGFEFGEQLLVIREVVLLGHPTNDMQLGDPVADKLAGAFDQLINAVCVGALVFFCPHRECAKAASDNANVGRVEVRIDVVGNFVTESATHNLVCRRAKLIERCGFVQEDCFLRSNTAAIGGASKDAISHVYRLAMTTASDLCNGNIGTIDL